jgi:hypothetical protein
MQNFPSSHFVFSVGNAKKLHPVLVLTECAKTPFLKHVSVPAMARTLEGAYGLWGDSRQIPVPVWLRADALRVLVWDHGAQCSACQTVTAFTRVETVGIEWWPSHHLCDECLAISEPRHPKIIAKMEARDREYQRAHAEFLRRSLIGNTRQAKRARAAIRARRTRTAERDAAYEFVKELGLLDQLKTRKKG